MSEKTIRETLEEQFTEAAASEPAASGNEIIVDNSGKETPADPYMDLPEGYAPEYGDTFKALAPEFRKYLHERAGEASKSLSEIQEKLNGYGWVEEAYAPRQERLKQLGFGNAREYFGSLAAIDDGFANNPEATIKALAEAYGVGLGGQQQAQPNPLENKVSQLENALQQMQQNQQKQVVEREFNDFANAKDEAGNVKHPYVKDVLAEIKSVFAAGAAKNFAEAYEKAVWLNPAVREKLIAEKAQADLKNKTAEAEKAKNAAFSPKGKQPGEKDFSDMSVREMLEAQMAGVDE